MSAEPPAHAVLQRNGLGILLRVAAMACMAGLAALVKACSERGAPVLEIIFFRNAFAFIPVLFYIWRTSSFSVLKTARPGGHLARSGIGLVGMVCGFTAVSMLPLTESTALSFAAPLFMTALSAPILKERVGGHRWAAVVVGFLGVLIMIRPDPTHMATLGTVFGLVGALGAAGAMIAIREIGRTEPGPTIVFYFTLAGMTLGLASLPFGGWVIPDTTTLVMLICTGLLGGVGQLFLTEALRRAPVAVVAPFDYTQLVWASIIGFLVWDELPRAATLVGACVVAASGVYILLRETRRFRR
ncbi:DMT family transporter [Phenylobacterium sp.]|uniref:DMT family transporter n=1 Tax=Phenylobacterium sp. TaxID=1871053 RepID=UPI00286AA2D1|nr:DMT family transporter [Phenylobacterium sp.]